MSVRVVLHCDVCSSTSDTNADRWGILTIPPTQHTNEQNFNLCPACCAKARGWRP